MLITCLIKCLSESRLWTCINLYIVAIYGFVFLVYFYWVISCFFVNGFLIWVFFFLPRILKFQRVTHNVFDKFWCLLFYNHFSCLIICTLIVTWLLNFLDQGQYKTSLCLRMESQCHWGTPTQSTSQFSEWLLYNTWRR